MDLWALKLSSGGGGGIGQIWGWKRKGAVVRQAPCWRKFIGREEEFIPGGVLEIRISTRYGGRRTSGYRSLEVWAAGKKNKKKKDEDSSSPGSDDPSIPEDDGSYGSNSPSDKTEFEEATYESHHTNIDWRTFRANLVAQEQVHLEDSNALTTDNASHESSKLLGLKWAHPIPMPETGCILVATDKLDGVPNFERTVVLLLRLGTKDAREGPFGVIINRPLHKKIKHNKPANPELATTFSDCSLHFGGPLDANMFLLRASEKSSLLSFEQVVPGICFGARNSLIEAAGLVKKGIHRPQDFRFFVGYAGWQLDQLRDEIESEYWIVAACSSDLIISASSDCMWEEILQLMGGRYSELSRKPKQDS